MPILNAVGTSLFAISAFVLATALNYARCCLVDCGPAGMLVARGLAGSLVGARAALRLAARRGDMNAAFATMIVVIALAMSVREFSL
jgi:uncharacterized membrane protein YfcA